MRSSSFISVVLCLLAAIHGVAGAPNGKGFLDHVVKRRVSPWVKWATGLLVKKVSTNLHVSAAHDRPECETGHFVNTTLPAFLRECAPLADPERTPYGCSITCSRVFDVLSNWENARCVERLLNEPTSLLSEGASDLPSREFFSALFLEAFTRCGHLPAHAKGPTPYLHSSFHCTDSAAEDYSNTLAHAFFQLCRPLTSEVTQSEDGSDQQAVQCHEDCLHVARAFMHHPCFQSYFESLETAVQLDPYDVIAAERMPIVRAVTEKCILAEDQLEEMRNLCDDNAYAVFETLSMPAFLHACVQNGRDYFGTAFPTADTVDSEARVTSCPNTCANMLWRVVQDAHCLQRFQRNAREQGGSGVVAQVLTTALDQCGLRDSPELEMLGGPLLKSEDPMTSVYGAGSEDGQTADGEQEHADQTEPGTGFAIIYVVIAAVVVVFVGVALVALRRETMRSRAAEIARAQ